MNEKPLERLNYYNGQRLQAADFRLEQEYHMRVRRWLNRSLFGPGIADGMTVTKVAGKPKVRIGPGLALDALGREIILLEEREEVVPGQHDSENRPLPLYLTIRYAEETLAQQDLACALGGGAKEKAAWGGPARVLAEPLLDWSSELPHEGSGRIPLARVTLGANCTVVDVLDTSVRDYVGEGSAARVKQYALEGFRDIDEANDGVIRFHIRGRQPSSVTLYLRGEKFPTYFYTELGRHKHVFTPEQESTLGAEPPTSAVHSHSDGTLTTDSLSHDHVITANWEETPFANAFALVPNISGSPASILPEVNGSMSAWSHFHSISGSTGSSSVTHHHTHKFTAVGQIENAGADVAVQSYGDSLKYVAGMQLSLRSGENVVALTNSVLTQLRNGSSAWAGKVLGDGSDTHLFVTDGTLGIRLDLLPEVSIGEGEYEIRLSAPASVLVPRNGGRIHYNLYVE